MINNPHIAAALAAQHRADLLRHAEQHRLVRAAKGRTSPASPRALLLVGHTLIRRPLCWLHPSTTGATA
jgi:hypothetical protein